MVLKKKKRSGLGKDHLRYPSTRLEETNVTEMSMRNLFLEIGV